ncbi:MAG TPA: hypothetical protein VMI73_26715 [Trebonia sp.]|nr:hypothetical protein [Trebonia sp.]
MARKMLKVVAGAAALLSLGAGVANAATSPATAAAWQSVGHSGVRGEVTAVTSVTYASGKVAEFAFAFHGTKPSLYTRSGGGAWAFDTINVAKTGERIVSAKAIGPNELLAFTRINGGQGRVLKRTGQTWTVLHTFGAEIGSASVLSASNVWVFGTSAKGGGNLGVWHFNGKAWTRVAKGYTDGGAQSSKDVWAASGTRLEHWNGAKWTATSIAGLVSQPTAKVSTIYTADADSPYAIVSENPTSSGPVVVLEYNGHAWKKVASYPTGSAVEGAAAGDGRSGLWFSVNRGAGKAGVLLHWGNHTHTLTVATVPGLNDSLGSAINSITQMQSNSTRELAGGYLNQPAGDPSAKVYYYN